MANYISKIILYCLLALLGTASAGQGNGAESSSPFVSMKLSTKVSLDKRTFQVSGQMQITNWNPGAHGCLHLPYNSNLPSKFRSINQHLKMLRNKNSVATEDQRRIDIKPIGGLQFNSKNTIVKFTGDLPKTISWTVTFRGDGANFGFGRGENGSLSYIWRRRHFCGLALDC